MRSNPELIQTNKLPARLASLLQLRSPLEVLDLLQLLLLVIEAGDLLLQLLLLGGEDHRSVSPSL